MSLPADAQYANTYPITVNLVSKDVLAGVTVSCGSFILNLLIINACIDATIDTT